MNNRHATPESFQHVAADLVSRRITSARPPAGPISSKQYKALSALLDQIARQMDGLPLKARLKFFRSSVAIVAEILAAMQRGNAESESTNSWQLLPTTELIELRAA